ncbi:MAG: ABC transporter ATP-binding protein [Candidatus Rokubacteria bacterium]|nr:ABC transporter ATP-binding protein [Candidatus Rokubacteria bacterium]
MSPGQRVSGEAGRIACEGVTKVYEHLSEPLVVLDGVSFAIEPGEFVSLVGPSGCGKSTLLRIIHGLTRATSGRVTVNGADSPRPAQDRGFVFQGDSLLPWRTVGANVRIGLEVRRAPRAEVRAEVERLLAVVGLTRFRHRYPHQLSGGMRQRANLVRALAVDPPVLLMDEPFGALDAQTRELMQTELLRIWEARKKTVLFVTHSIEEAVLLSDRVLLMTGRPGRIRAQFRVDVPRPRDPEVRRTASFAELCRGIWEQLRDDALAAFEEETRLAT